MEKSFFDSYIGAALEYDIFAGGDPNRTKSDRYTSQAAAIADKKAVIEKEAVDAGIVPEQQPQGQQPENNLQETKPEENSDFSENETDEMGNIGEAGQFNNDAESEDSAGMSETSDEENPEGTSEDPVENQNAQLEKKRKETLFEVTTSLHAAVSNNIEMLQKINPPIDENANKIYFDVINQLRQCKDTLYHIAVKDIQNGDYVDTLRKITAISKIYELSVETIKIIYAKTD